MLCGFDGHGFAPSGISPMHGMREHVRMLSSTGQDGTCGGGVEVVRFMQGVGTEEFDPGLAGAQAVVAQQDQEWRADGLGGADHAGVDR